MSVSVRFSFLFRKSRFVLFCIRFQTSRFSFASSLIERVIKDIFSTLMYVCVKRNICLNLCGWQIYWILFYWRNHRVVFSDSHFIATFIEGECYGNVGACPCTGQCSVAQLLCVRSHYYRRSHMYLLECNVCRGITAVVLSRCRSLYLTPCGSLWTPMAS